MQTVEQAISAGVFTLVDVRTPAEFNSGHVAQAINIPLNEVQSRVSEFETMQAPVLLCCASGGRSGQATAFLDSKGIDCYNLGGWHDAEQAINNYSHV